MSKFQYYHTSSRLTVYALAGFTLGVLIGLGLDAIF